MKKVIECVPNFSEGRDLGKIKQITNVVESVKGVKLLDVDPGYDTNRTVVTFVGNPDDVVEAAYLAIKKANEIIDMRTHQGEHPRFGATDVCPLVPVANISMEETVQYAHKLAERVGKELHIPVYCYEFAANNEKRRSLAYCRSGEYEKLEQKITSEDMKPDFGSTTWDVQTAKSGATAIGARNFLVAYNVNLNTTSTRRANAIAFDVREAGRVKREGNLLTGKIVNDDNGEPVRIPGTLKKTRAIGWFIKEYGVAQISMNLTDITVTSVHKAFDEVSEKARARGIRVTGSELVGLIPLNAMLDAGRYFLEKQERSTGVSDDELIKIAVKSMGLDELSPFDPKKKIIEYQLKDQDEELLRNMTLKAFVEETASESPAPGGGSISAYVGSLGAALAGMVANLSAHKRGWDYRWREFSDWAEKGKYYHQAMLEMVDKDTDAFNQIMQAFSLPKGTDEEKKIRSEAIVNATKNAVEVPLQVMQLAYDSLEVIEAMAEKGNPNSISDAGVGALCAKAAVEGAFLNVRINLAGFQDADYKQQKLEKARKIIQATAQKEKQILELVHKSIEE